MLSRSAALRNRVLAAPGQYRALQVRHISIQPLYASPDKQEANSDIPREDKASQLRELASDIESALRSVQSVALNTWADRIGRISKHTPPLRRVGVLYATGKESQTAQLAGAIIGFQEAGSDTHAFADEVCRSLYENSTAIASLSPEVGRFDNRGVSFLAATVANTDRDLFADWLYSCEHIVLVTDRSNIVQTLISTPGLWLAMRFHPRVRLAVDGLESSSETVAAFSDLLRESLTMLGASESLFGSTPHLITSLAAACAKPDASNATSGRSVIEELINDAPSGESSRMDLLASSLGAAIACVENGGTTAFIAAPPSSKTQEIVEDEASVLLTSRLSAFLDKTDGCDLGLLSLPSKRIQDDFESGDLQTVDASVGIIKQRICKWFASGKIWQSMFMRVYEVSDTLIDNAIVDRSFEEADLGMVHATGRLNESVKRIASELANEIDALSTSVSPGTVAMTASNPSAVVAAKNALCALAQQKEPIHPFRLARQVWAARERLAQSEIVEGIPRYIHTSLAQFWSIHAVALTGATTSIVYFSMPVHLAMTGGLSVSILAFVWLARRWNQLRSNLYKYMDNQATSMRTELSAVHKAVLQSELDSPISACVKDITGLHMAIDYTGLAFAALIAVGGAVGYFKSGSVASLVSGLVFGALISFSVQLAAGNSKSYSLLPAVLCLVLCLVMGNRFLSSKKFMPAGMVATTSLLMVIRYVLKAF
ncbi:Transmembrane protein 14C [Coemansia sp. RSA 720]|nr:Transmembrane protein 14C [Coemansia sp. RSA 720]